MKGAVRLAMLIGVGCVAMWLLPLVDRLGAPFGTWDEASLRRAFVVLIVVFLLGGLGAIVPKQVRDFLPSGPFWRLVMMAGITLTFLQYAAFDAGQPLMLAEHIIVRVMQTVGAESSDMEVYRGWLHHHFAASGRADWVAAPGVNSVLLSDLVLIGAGWFLMDWSVRMARHLLRIYADAKTLIRRGLWGFAEV
jgi:hypothetical protein